MLLVRGNFFNLLMEDFGGSAGNASGNGSYRQTVSGITICYSRPFSHPVNCCDQVQVRVDENTRNYLKWPPQTGNVQCNSATVNGGVVQKLKAAKVYCNLICFSCFIDKQ